MSKQNGNSPGFNTVALDQKSRAAQEAFLDAVATGDTEKLAKIPLEEQRALVNCRDMRGGHMQRTALIYASQNGREDIVRHLLSLGADVNIKDEDGWSALTAAVANGALWALGVLLDSHADINNRDREGWTPLMEALNRDREGIALMLIARGADLRPVNGDGMTAMDMAQDLGLEKAAEAMAPILQKLDTDASVAAMRGGTARRISAPSPARFRKAG